MLRTSLTDSQRAELQALRRTDLPAVARDRLEMVLLSAAGWSPPQIATHLGRHPHTALKGYAARGTAAFYPDAPGPDPDHARQAVVTGKLAEPLAQDRPATGRRPRPRRGHRAPPDPPLPGPPRDGLPPHRPGRRPRARPEEGRAGRARPRLVEKKLQPAG